MVDAKAAKLILDKELNSEVLSKTLEDMLANKEELIKMGENAEKVSMENVEEKIYQEIKQHIKL